jgi:tRNA(Ile)-lysidine synthetase-like protein
VLPALEAALPGAVRSLARAAGLLAADEAYLGRRADHALRRLRGDGVDAAALVQLPAAVRGRAVRRLFREAGGPAPSRADVERVLAVAARGGDVHLRGGLRARCRRGRLVVAPAPTGRAARHAPPRPLPPEVPLAPGRPAELGELRIEVAAGVGGAGRDPWRFELPAAVAPPFVLRPVGAGDRVPVPGVGRRKIRDLLREAGVAAEDRERVVVLWAGGGPAWLPGVRALVARPAVGEPAWLFRATRRRPPGNEGGAPMVGAGG